MGSQSAELELERPHVGGRPLTIFTHALSAGVLRAHDDRGAQNGGLSCRQLQESIGWASQSSLRAAVGEMSDFGALEKRDADSCPHGGTTSLSAAGRELLAVAAALERWLQEAPSGPISLEEDAARAAVKILLAAWDSTLIRHLAEQPSALADLSARIPVDSDSTLRRRLAQLRAIGLVTRFGAGRSTTYAVTDWLRRAVVPLALADRWELRHAAHSTHLTGTGAEAALLLLLPLAKLSPRASGTVTLAVLTRGYRRGKTEAAGVTVEVDRGAVSRMAPSGDEASPTWVLGTAQAWLDATIDGAGGSLRIGGPQPRLALHIVNGIRRALRCPA